MEILLLGENENYISYRCSSYTSLILFSIITKSQTVPQNLVSVCTEGAILLPFKCAVKVMDLI